MRITGAHTRRVISLAMCAVLLISMLAFAFTVRAVEVDEAAVTGDTTYYLWGESTNSPNFSGTTPSGTFTYDSSKGYYYYDLSGSSNDYCFVISTVSNSANRAVTTPAIQTAASSGSYYLQKGNYHGFNCFHIWNPSGDTVRFYFTSTSAGLYAVKAGSDSPTTAPTTAPQPTTPQPTQGGGTTPTTPQPTQSGGDSGKTYVYCENEAGWSTVYAYMWIKDTETNNAAWPGKQMTNIRGNIWRYEVTNSKLNMIIFNIGSNQTQTGNLTFPGKDYMYNNKTNTWSIYDTSPLQVTSFTTDVESPQHNGVGIVLSAEAEGQGTVYYKFSVSNGSTTTVLSDFSTRNQVQWVPQFVGTYTITYNFKDSAGNLNQRTKTFTIDDGSSSVYPFIKTVTPSSGEIQQNKAVNMQVNAGGGITGTNLLFYKFTVRDSSGDIVNTPYYTLSKNYSFTPSLLGAYSVTVSIQGSDNKTVERTYNFESVSSYTPTEPYATEPPVTPTTPQPTTPPPTQPMPTESGITALYGDADDDGDVNAVDVTFIQRFEAGIELPLPLNEVNADVDGDEDVNIIDATLIQRFLAGLFSKFPVEA